METGCSVRPEPEKQRTAFQGKQIAEPTGTLLTPCPRGDPAAAPHSSRWPARPSPRAEPGVEAPPGPTGEWILRSRRAVSNRPSQARECGGHGPPSAGLQPALRPRAGTGQGRTSDAHTVAACPSCGGSGSRAGLTRPRPRRRPCLRPAAGGGRRAALNRPTWRLRVPEPCAAAFPADQGLAPGARGGPLQNVPRGVLTELLCVRPGRTAGTWAGRARPPRSPSFSEAAP